MSDAITPGRQRRDQGMTLPELLIAITVIGLIMTVLSGTVVVTLRQQANSDGRINVARAEQSSGMWRPTGLSSAAAVTVDPAATACDRVEIDGTFVVTGDACPNLGLRAGSNALLIGWSMTDAEGNVTYTNVSYFFAP